MKINKDTIKTEITSLIEAYIDDLYDDENIHSHNMTSSEKFRQNSLIDSLADCIFEVAVNNKKQDFYNRVMDEGQIISHMETNSSIIYLKQYNHCIYMLEVIDGIVVNAVQKQGYSIVNNLDIPLI